MSLRIGVTTLFVGFALLTGCAAEESDTENAKNLQEGTWGNTCATDTKNLRLTGDDGPPSYRSETLKFDGSTFTYESNSFSDTTCATQTMGIKLTGTYKTGDEAATPATTVEGASNIDITVSALQMAVFDDNTLTFVNDPKSECGTTATKGVYFDPTNCTFMKKDAEGGGGAPAVGAVWYQIFAATDTTLQWGLDDDTHNGDTAATRPVALDTNGYAKK